jgi:glycosyltransferase involved in cell wall biosynthesis
MEAGLEDEVEIIIGNDFSPDDTYKYVNKVTNQYSFVYGFNHKKNLGLSQNVEFLVNEARGQYILICSDDDLLKDGAIAQIIKSIKEKRPNFILINTSNMLSLDKANLQFKIILENRLNIDQDIFVENFDKDGYLLRPAKNWLYLTNFLTAVVFKKKLFQLELINAKKYLRPENLWLWQAPNIIGIKKYGRLLVIAERFVLCRKNENNWTNDPRGSFFTNLFDSAEICKLIKDYMSNQYKNYKKLYASFIISELMTEIGKGMNVRMFAWSALRNNFDCFPQNIQFLFILTAPKFTLKIVPKLRRVILALRRR